MCVAQKNVLLVKIISRIVFYAEVLIEVILLLVVCANLASLKIVLKIAIRVVITVSCVHITLRTVLLAGELIDNQIRLIVLVQMDFMMMALLQTVSRAILSAKLVQVRTITVILVKYLVRFETLQFLSNSIQYIYLYFCCFLQFNDSIISLPFSIKFLNKLSIDAIVKTGILIRELTFAGCVHTSAQLVQ